MRTDPADVARVESKTLISTSNRRDTIPTPAEGVQGKLGYWLSPEDMQNAFNDRFPGCMKGKVLLDLQCQAASLRYYKMVVYESTDQ